MKDKFSSELAALYANPKHKECRGRGYVIVANPGQKEEKIYCSCAVRNFKKVIKSE